jgi:hypothetical protein
MHTMYMGSVGLEMGADKNYHDGIRKPDVHDVTATAIDHGLVVHVRALGSLYNKTREKKIEI